VRPTLLAGLAAGAAVLLRGRREIRHRERLAAASLETLLNAIDANDHTTGAHVRRVASASLVLGREAGLDERACRSVERVALFHDIGKIHAALFDIIHEGAPLSARERRLIATHPQRGAEVLRPLTMFYPDLCEGVLSHHERWDGTGYPRGLRGPEIPLQARIVGIADAFDAITRSRPYKGGSSHDEAVDRIWAGRGTQFDPELVDLFVTPHVIRDIEHAMAAAHRPRSDKRADADRRQSDREVWAPDVTFRWRRESSVQPAPDRRPRKSRGSPPPRPAPRPSPPAP
jgi:HD-GYP domain-containing protein (c-di-GMP phosphodiesterase class II)